jgi:hypothetical protein
VAKPSKMTKKSKEKLRRARKAQTKAKAQNAQKLKINTPLKSTPANTLNASSPT